MALLYCGVNQKIGALTEKTATAQACNTLYDERRKSLLGMMRWPHALKRAQLTPYAGVAYDATRTFAKGDLSQLGDNVYRSLLDVNLNHQPDQNSSVAWWAQVTRDGWAFVCPLPPDCLDPISAWEKLSVSALATPQIFSFKDPTDFNLRNPRSSQRAPFKLENSNDGADLMVLLSDIDTPILLYTADVTNPATMPAEFAEVLAWDMAGPLAMGIRGDEKKALACMSVAKSKMADAFVTSMRNQQEDQEPISEFEAAREGSA